MSTTGGLLRCLAACALAACAASEAQVGELQSDIGWTVSIPSGHLHYVINPSVMLNHGADKFGPSSNPFGFRVFWRTQFTVNKTIAAPTMTVSPTSHGETVACTHDAVPGCLGPAFNSYCMCQVMNGQPNTTYQYTVKLDGGTWSGWVTTRPATGTTNHFSFALYSDVHENPANHQEVLTGIQNENTDFGLYAGDWGETNEWGSFDDTNSADAGLADDAVSGYRSSWPLFPALGGHDWMAAGTVQVFGGWPTVLKMFVGAPNTSNDWEVGSENRFYSFDWGNAHFLVLDTGMINDFCRGGCL